MKCLNCGHDSQSFLCSNCCSAEILDKIFNEIWDYKPENCDNPYLAEYASGLSEKYEERNCIPEILSLFDFDISEYYYCRYYRMRRDPRLEQAALAYLETHDFDDFKSQRVLYDLLDSYLRNDFIKPQKWCRMISDTDKLCIELYYIASQFYSMIAEYELAKKIVDKALTYLSDSSYDHFLFYSREGAEAKLAQQKNLIARYRSGKPYWPTTEERRRAVAMFYDEKGITYPRITSRPEKIRESDFKPINESFQDELSDYTVFWCEEAYSISAAKSIYQIAAVRIRDNKVCESFQSLIRPWDGLVGRKDAARKAGVSLDVIESADDPDLVLPKFFEFAADDILVSTGALGNQAKLLSRAARYAGMKEIKNEFWDLLDYAADTNSDFDLEHNTREFLLSYFKIEEGKDALAKALANHTLYLKLRDFKG